MGANIFSWIKNSKQPKIVFYSCLRWNDCLKFMDTWFNTSWYTQELMALNNTTTSSWKLNLTSSLPPIPYISSISLFCWFFLGDVTQKLQLELTVGWNPLASANYLDFLGPHLSLNFDIRTAGRKCCSKQIYDFWGI